MVSVSLAQVLIDGGISLNNIYMKTLDDMKIPRFLIKPGAVPFHGVVPGNDAQPLGHITLDVSFGAPNNFCRATMNFEVVGFRGTYNALLGRPFFTKFMVTSTCN